MKQRNVAEIAADQVAPIGITAVEVPLVWIGFTDVVPGDRIVLQMEIGWEKPFHADLGALEVMVRKETHTGPLIYYAEESCFQSARTMLEHVEIAASSVSHAAYYLIARSMEGRARIVGPIRLIGSLISA